MALNFRKFLEGLRIVPKTSSTASEKGDLDVTNGNGKLNYHNGTSASPIVTEAHSAILTNKTIDGDDNTIQDIGIASLKTVIADANKVIRRDAAGVVVSDNSIPNSSSLVTTDATQTLTNKSLSDSTTTIVDVTDPTKQIKFDVAGTTSTSTTILSSQTTNKTLTLPDATDTLVGKATQDSFTNKTFDAEGTGNSLTNVKDSNIKVGADISRAKLASGTANHVIINDGTGVLSSEASLDISRGGTGQTTQQTAINALAGATTSGQYLRGNGTNVVMSAIQAADVPTLNQNTTGTASNVTGVVAIINGGTGQTTQTAAFDALAPTTTAGDLIVHNGTDNVRQGIGTDGQVLVADNTQPNKLKWATLQQGAKNYITYGTFENGATTGWSLFNTTLTSKIPTGSITAGAASITSFAVDSTTPIAGTYDLRVASSGALTAGQGFISDAFTIDREDQAKPLAFSFAYEAVSGTMDFSGTSNNTWAVYIYDVSGSAWIQPAGVYNLVQSSGVGIASGSFQTTATGTQYQIAVVCITATAGAVEMRFDTFQLGPQTNPAGAAISDWTSYTPTGTWVTNATYTGKYRRVGDSIEVQARVATSGAPSGALTFNIPAGLVIDTAKLNSSVAGFTAIEGQAVINDSSTTGYKAFPVYNSTTSILVAYQNNVSGAAAGASQVAPITFGAGDSAEVVFTVPITGFSSNTVLSQDTDTRVVAASFSVTGSHTSSGSFQAIPSLTVRGDTNGMISGTTVTIPVSGWYDFSGNIGFIANSTGIRDVQIAFSPLPSGVPFSPTTQFSSPQVALTGGQTHVGVGGAIYLNAGTQVTFLTYQNSGGNLAYGDTLLTIKRLSGPATIAASETVAASYGTSAAPLIPNNSATIVVYPTRQFDTHSMVNPSTGVVTIPVSGKYLLSAGHYFANAIAATATDVQTICRKNGVTVQGTNVPKSGTSAGPLATQGTFLVQCLAGDTIGIFLLQANSAATAQPLLASAEFNYMTITRVGN